MLQLDNVQVAVVGLPIYFHFTDPSGTPIDLTDVDSIQGRLRGPSNQPSGNADTITVTVSGSATLGIGVWTTTAITDIDEPGVWEAQAWATFDATHIYPSEVVRFNAKANLPVV